MALETIGIHIVQGLVVDKAVLVHSTFHDGTPFFVGNAPIVNLLGAGAGVDDIIRDPRATDIAHLCSQKIFRFRRAKIFSIRVKLVFQRGVILAVGRVFYHAGVQLVKSQTDILGLLNGKSQPQKGWHIEVYITKEGVF